MIQSRNLFLKGYRTFGFCFPFSNSCAMTSDSEKKKKMETKQTSGGRGTFELIVQLITALAVLAGIYLVMVELRQGREISTGNGYENDYQHRARLQNIWRRYVGRFEESMSLPR